MTSLLECKEAEMMVEPMMTARQVAELLGVHENWVYDQAVGGDLPSYKIGGARRFQAEEVQRWIAEHREAERASRGSRRVVRTEARDVDAERPKRTPRARPRSRSAAVEVSANEQPRLFES
jgi:excisionase family DNA binding protein